MQDSLLQWKKKQGHPHHTIPTEGPTLSPRPSQNMSSSAVILKASQKHWIAFCLVPFFLDSTSSDSFPMAHGSCQCCCAPGAAPLAELPPCCYTGGPQQICRHHPEKKQQPSCFHPGPSRGPTQWFLPADSSLQLKWEKSSMLILW